MLKQKTVADNGRIRIFMDVPFVVKAGTLVTDLKLTVGKKILN